MVFSCLICFIENLFTTVKNWTMAQFLIKDDFTVLVCHPFLLKKGWNTKKSVTTIGRYIRTLVVYLLGRSKDFAEAMI